jgi:hypothetical protein
VNQIMTNIYSIPELDDLRMSEARARCLKR